MKDLMNEKIRTVISRTIIYLNLFFVLVIIVLAIGKPDRNFWKDFFGSGSIRVLILSGSVWFLLLFYAVLDQFHAIHTKKRAMLLFAFVLSVFIIQLVVVAVVDLDLIYDSSKIYECALAFVNGQEPLNDYMGMYPHQTGSMVATVCLLLMFKMLRLPADMYVTGLSVVMVLFTDLSLAIMSRLAHRLLDADAVKTVVPFLWFLALISPSTILWGGFFYPTVLSLPFFSFTLYCCVMSFQTMTADKRRFYVYVFSAFVIGLAGYHIRATMAIVLIAYVIALAYAGLSENRAWKRIVPVMGIVLLSVALDSCCYQAVFNRVAANRDADREFPLLDWVLIGVSDGGAHNTEDEAYIGEIEGYAAKEEAIKTMIAERVSGRNIRGTLKWLGDKIYTSWGNGTRDIHGYFCRTNRYTVLHDWIVGDQSGLFSTYSQIFNTVLWILIFLGLIVNRKESGSATLFFGLIFTGNFLFYLFWEVQGQYNLSIEPLKLFAAAYSAEKIFIHLGTENTKKTKYLRKYALTAFLLTGIILFFEIKTYHAVKEAVMTGSRRVVYQQMWNEKYSLKPEHTLKQTFAADRPFNAFDIIFKNPSAETNDVVYEIVLESDKRGIISKEVLAGCDIPSKYFYMGRFDEVYPEKNEEFAISVTALEGTADIGLYIYKLKQFVAYRKGVLSVSGPGVDTQELRASLTFSVSDEYVGPYVSKKLYVGVCIILLMIVSLPMVWAALKYKNRI